MTTQILDRRVNGKNKSSSNRQRFVRRVNKHVRNAIRENIKNGNVSDIMNDNEQSVSVPKKNISEPWFHHAAGGNTERVYPGNKEFSTGDRIPKPSGSSSGSKGVGDGEGEDDFQFMISKKEYMDIFFEDLELPDLVKKQLSSIVETKLKRAGFAVDGVPSRLNYIRSLKQSIGRRAALRNPKKRKLAELEEELAELRAREDGDDFDYEQRLEEIIHIEQQIEALKRKIKAIPFIDTIDLRYNRFEVVSVPTTRAVMFMLMDVSGSMGEFEKEMAKRFYMLLYIFLNRTYEHVDIVPIRYHTDAKEVDEQEFFYSKETGGTLVSPALELARDIMKERYDHTWNIYFCHASDGDNSTSNTEDCVDLLDEIIPSIQHFAYIQIGTEDNTLSRMYDDDIMTEYDNVDQVVITGPEDIFPVFRKLFEKESA
jgi:uncharacterized sporulation protein YeaH/YhbH (DUF444 family)